MKKLYVYIDETYQLQHKNQFYAFAGFITYDNELVKKEYRRFLKKIELVGKEIKSTDKDSEKIRMQLFNAHKIVDNVDIIGIYQKKDSMHYKYFRNSVGEQEVILYEELIKIFINEVIKKYNDEKIELNFIFEIDKNDKIKKDYFRKLEIFYSEKFKYKIIDIQILTSNNSLGLQLADQIAGLLREYIKNENQMDIIKKYKIIEINPLSKN